MDQTDHAQLIARSETKFWLSFEQRRLKGIVAKFSEWKIFLSSPKNSSCLLPLEMVDKIREIF